MTVKDLGDAPLVPATLVSDEPEINLSSSAAAVATAPPYVQATSVASAEHPKPTTTTTTTTYVIPPSGPPASPGGFGRESCSTTCPNCHQQVRTRVRHHADGMTILGVVLLLLFFWPLFWLPLVMPGCKSSEHYCTSCNYRIAKEESCS